MDGLKETKEKDGWTVVPENLVVVKKVKNERDIRLAAPPKACAVAVNATKRAANVSVGKKAHPPSS
ncbi:MAG: hypothetical protein EBU90_29710 [Proteobacteria bacterium]|nr:hypothetical protein [Pseudomonadota bacterium]NBP16844.1 hypothetical protein [bacterium]